MKILIQEYNLGTKKCNRDSNYSEKVVSFYALSHSKINPGHKSFA